ncbi:MAG TPA: ABC transporter ATP-binding protein, partial [Candidatus Anaerostipes avistercoris]|nr:ABC transporter ATP-binding protein [Candidatus Anaerostipes avistercoris]
GKTTTIKSILDITHRDKGSVKFFGKSSERNLREIKDRLGVVFDDSYFYDELTMAEMKSIIAPAYSRWSDSRYKSYMEKFNLNPNQKIATLSKGMKTKFALVLALSHEAELLIMDEPTSGLDPLMRSQLLEVLKEYMKEGGKGVFFSTHIVSDLEKIADMLILIDNGEILLKEEKDILLDKFRKIKGDINWLNDSYKKLFLTLKVTDYGFTGITAHAREFENGIKDIVVERPTLEEIMLAYIERRRGNVDSFN